MRNGKGKMRTLQAGYLAYALMDAVIDYYYPALEKIGLKLDDLEDELLSNPSQDSMNRILQIKRELIVFRRAIWPERDKINDILRSSFDEVPEETKLFLEILTTIVFRYLILLRATRRLQQV